MKKRLISFYKRVFYKLYKPPVLPPATDREQALIDEVRTDVSAMMDKNILANTDWAENQRELAEDIQNKDPRNFANWPVIKKTMFHTAFYEEYEYLRKHPDWQKLKPILKEDKAGNPEKYYLFPSGSGNLLHHLYSYLRFTDTIKTFNLSSIHTIFEFGGGYGSFCRLLYRLGFNGSYCIYDLPLFSCLQKFFLGSVHPRLDIDYGVLQDDTSKRIVLMNDFAPSVEEGLPVDLFIALWSISECPLDLRKKVFDKINPSYYLIGYQSTFSGVDNQVYFRSFVQDRPDYDWHQSKIDHLKGNYYLFGIKKSLIG